MRKIIRFRLSNPTSTLRRLRSVFRKRPAPTSSTSDIATCATRSAFDSVERAAVAARLFSFSAALTSSRVARSAGTMPKVNPVTKVTAAANAKTRQSNDAAERQRLQVAERRVVDPVRGRVDVQLRHRRAVAILRVRALRVAERRVVLVPSGARRLPEDAVEAALHLRRRDSRLHASDRLQPPPCRLLQASRLIESRIEREWHGDVGRGAERFLNPGEARRRDADDGDGDLVDLDDLADDVRAAAEAALPEAFAQHRDRRRRRRVVGGDEGAADERRDPEHLEEIARRLEAGDDFRRLAVGGEAALEPRRARGETGERRAARGAQPLDRGIRERRANVAARGILARPLVVARLLDHVVAADPLQTDERVGPIDAVERLEQQAVERVEKRDVRADAERDREHDDTRSSLALEEQATGAPRNVVNANAQG